MSSPPRRAALYLDFDNLFAGLALRDEAAAWHFAAEPGRWLGWLAAGGDGGGPRRILVRRCYLNPAGWTEPVAGGALAEWLGQPRIFYSRFRADFVRAGFTVIDCPRLARLKNGADILMALDVADALAHPTRFEEFILLSGDSDFTPLLHRLREHDRRTLLVAQDASAQALRAAADAMIGFEDFAAVMLQPEPAPATETDPARQAEARRALEDATRRILAAHDGRIRLSALGQALRFRFGDAVDATSYAGAGSLRKLVAAMPGLQVGMEDGTDWAQLAGPVAEPQEPAEDPFAVTRELVAEAGGSLATAALGTLFQQRLGVGLRGSAYAGAGSLDAFVARAGLCFAAEGNDRNTVVLAPAPEGGDTHAPPASQAAVTEAAPTTWAATACPAPGLGTGPGEAQDAEEAADAPADDPALPEGADAADAPDGPLAELLRRALGPGLDLSGLAAPGLAAILAVLGARLPIPGPPDPALAEAVADAAAAAAGAPPPPHAVARLVRLLQLGRFDWGADPGPDPAGRIAAALEAEIRRQASISRARLTPEEQAALTAWIHAAPEPATPP